MTARGSTPLPKDPAQRRRRNRDAIPKTVVSVDDELRGPDLPYGHDWPKRTREWWLTWRQSAQSQAFTPSDWDFLLDTALLHAELWAGNGSVAGELRIRVAKFGATPEDRIRLRMEITAGEPKAEESAKPASRYGHLRSA